jgi:serine/threonine-protein kinase
MAVEELKQLGRYDLVRVLGKGAMGIVYEGMDPKLHRKVAIKTILKGHMDDDEAAKEYSMRFMREAQAVARLNHPHIVQVYDFGEEANVAYIVMEFIKGKELKNFFDANERFELKEAVRIMCELLDALDFAHEGGIVHRDIKPANVMLDGQARVKLADFGVARVTDDRSAAEKTQAGTMVGTPAYMSPEQITGGNVDRRTDIFSAGIILYQFLTGEKPFTGSGAWTIAKKIIQDHPPVPSSINNTISPLFDNVVNKALSKTVEGRYQTAKEFGAALKRALEGRSEEDDADKTVFTPGGIGAMADLSPAAAAVKPESTKTGTSATGSQEVELEFWRAIKDGNDPDDFELYVQQFPNGIYAALAKRKIAKLKGVAPEESGARAKEQERKEAEEAAKREAEVKQKLAEEKAKLEAQLAAKEAEYAKREKEAEARRIADEKARAEAEAKREAEMKARAEAEAKARREEFEKQRKEAEALAAKREAEAKAKYEAEMARRDAEAKAAKAQAEAEAKARRESELKAKQEAEALAAKARAEAEERARKQAESLAKAKEEAEARAKREADERAKREAEAAKREAEAAKREADLKKKLAEAPRAKVPVAPIIAAIVAVAAIGGGGYWYATKEKREKEAVALAMLEEAAKQSNELKLALNKQNEALKALEQARAAEEAARKSGDAAKLREAQEASRRAEEEAKKQAELVKQREAAAAKAREDAKKAQDAAKQAAATPPKQEQKQEVAAVAPQKAPEPQRTEPQKPEPQRAEPQKPAPQKAEAPAEPAKPRALTRSERERLADEEAARKALAAAGKSAPPPTVVASAAPTSAAVSSATPGTAPSASAPAAAAAPAKAATEFETLYQQALAMEQAGNAAQAIRVYRRAARAGSGKAAKRLGEIYDRGVPGVSRDYAESLQWYETARQLGEKIEEAKARGQ